ncbi:MAG: alternative ribosome rescue aminoacyl-tRNA hydrolase ArfB [Phycisphaerae bacterium]
MARLLDTPTADALRALIPEDQLRFTFSRSSGPGGQNVNKTNTRVTLWFTLDACDTLTAREKRRITRKLPGRVSAAGVLRVVSMRHRTQDANRRAAVARFYELLAEALERPKPRRATKVPARARRQRVEDKRRRGEIKRLRRV